MLRMGQAWRQGPEIDIKKSGYGTVFDIKQIFQTLYIIYSSAQSEIPW